VASDYRLLVMSCSQRKRQTPGLLPAVERYDGPAFKVLRRFLREQPEVAEHLEVFILSAAYGLFPAKHPVRDYDRVMTPQRTAELHKDVLATFTDVVGNGTWAEICLALSKRYMAALEGWNSLIPAGVSITMADGPQGIRLAKLKRWLWGENVSSQRPKPVPERPTSSRDRVARLRGVKLELGPDQVLVYAREALANDEANAGRFREWYVEVDDHRVAPKWLASVLTGLPVSGFTSGEAQRVLRQLGLDTQRV